MLLKDQWRHKVAVRDDDPAKRSTTSQDLIIDGRPYAALKAMCHNDSVSLGALALATLHSVLHAYGHGNQTVLAFLDVTETRDPHRAPVLPVVVDHARQSELTRKRIG
jgi:N-(5-amino-5-carboxypentanoyl)-L-cysteinyl-D-valine synthase